MDSKNLLKRRSAALSFAFALLFPLVVDSGPAHAISAHIAFQNKETGACIGHYSGAKPRAGECRGMGATNFERFQDGPGFWLFRNSSTGACLDDSLAYGLRTIGCNFLDFQKWRIVPAELDGFKVTWFYVQNKETGRCIDDSQRGLRIWECNSLNFQKWRNWWSKAWP